jgi:hypothetical protein
MPESQEAPGTSANVSADVGAALVRVAADTALERRELRAFVRRTILGRVLGAGGVVSITGGLPLLSWIDSNYFFIPEDIILCLWFGVSVALPVAGYVLTPRGPVPDGSRSTPATGADLKTLPKWWFGPPPEFQHGETWEASHAANRAQGGRAVGGGLHFTNRRALFTPNVIDSALGGEAWSCSLDDIVAVSVAPPRFAVAEVFSGGLRSRLRLELRSGDANLFVIASPANVVAKLDGLRRARRVR